VKNKRYNMEYPKVSIINEENFITLEEMP